MAAAYRAHSKYAGNRCPALAVREDPPGAVRLQLGGCKIQMWNDAGEDKNPRARVFEIGIVAETPEPDSFDLVVAEDGFYHGLPVERNAFIVRRPQHVITPRPKGSAARNDSHRVAQFGQMQSGLKGSVSAADYNHIPASVKAAITPVTLRDPAAGELDFPGDANLAQLSTAGEDDRLDIADF